MPGQDVMQGWAIWSPWLALAGTAALVLLGMAVNRKRGPRG